ncbi:MAG: acyloxyacyl hydrolase [Rickettsiales bacterium]|jgi:hypothetical protein|nr:acyloxyacyl hydrolase [Rickettsiales bacterium]
MIKKIILCFAILCGAANAETEGTKFNPFFGDKQNQLGLAIGQGFDSAELILFKHLDVPVPYYMIAASYSQPNTFFRLPGRQTIGFTKTLGFGHHNYGKHAVWTGHTDWQEYGNEIAVLTQEVGFALTQRTYLGAGIGIAIQGKQNARLNTKFILPFKMVAGWRMTDSWNLELIMQHFSNGDTGDMNYVYDFYALGVSWNF